MYFKKKDQEIEEIMDELSEKISKFLKENPNSNARRICKEVGADKKAVNSCLYSNIKTHFLKEGLTPPLWRNISDSSKTKTVETEIVAFDENDADEDLEFEIEDGDESINEVDDESKEWTRLNAEDQQIYLKLNAYIARGEILSRPDRRLMNQLVEKIRQSESSERSSIKKQGQKAKNRAKFAAKVNEKVDEVWSADEQRSHAIEALTRQFESSLRKLAYAHLNSNNEKRSDEKPESDLEIRLAELRERVDAASSYLETRLSNLENLSDTDLVSAGARLAWHKLISKQSNLADPRSANEIFPKLDESKAVKIYKLRFQKIVQRVDKS